MVNETQGYIAILVFEQDFSSLPMFEDCHGLDVFVNKYFHKVALEVGNNNTDIEIVVPKPLKSHVKLLTK